jgi:phenylacetate-CoA ligase
VYSSIYAKLIYPAYHRAIGSDATSLIRELNSHDRLSRDELASLESKKLSALLLHARESVPYYGQLLARHDPFGSSGVDYDRFSQLPLLTKAIIRNNLKELVSARLDGNRLDPNSTSGSTGEPLSFFTDLRSKSYRKAAVARNRKWIGIENGDPVARLWGSDIDARKAQSMRGKVHSIVTRELFLSAYDLDDACMTAYSRAIRRHGTKLLIGYPSVLATFGEFCRDRSIEFPSVSAVVCSAEALHPFQRESIESCFSAPLYNRYGCREVGDIAQEVPGLRGLVVNSDRIYVEILDESGKACGPETVGNIVITDLDNYGMPLIRYQTGDRGSWAVPDSKAMLPYPVLSSVEGRNLDVVIAPSGNRIGGTFWTILLRKRPGIKAFRIVQGSLSSLSIQYIRMPGVSDIDLPYFETKIREKCGPEMAIEFQEVEEFNIPPGEKFRLVKSTVGQQ